MGKSSISKQADKYAEVIVGQIAGNFVVLQATIDANSRVEIARK